MLPKGATSTHLGDRDVACKRNHGIGIDRKGAVHELSHDGFIRAGVIALHYADNLLHLLLTGSAAWKDSSNSEGEDRQEFFLHG